MAVCEDSLACPWLSVLVHTFLQIGNKCGSNQRSDCVVVSTKLTGRPAFTAMERVARLALQIISKVVLQHRSILKNCFVSWEVPLKLCAVVV